MLPKERARQSVPASRAAGALHQSVKAVLFVRRWEPTHEEETVTSESPILNVLVKIIPIERARKSVPASRAEGELHQQG